MQTILEIFYMRVVDEEVRYRRAQANLSETREDPDHIIQSLIWQKYHLPTHQVDEEFVVHSTSWRYSPPDKIILTYVAYSDELEFDSKGDQRLPLEALRRVTISTPRPQSPAELEKQVVSHALRHLAFLVKTDEENALHQVLTPESLAVFEELWVSLAGRVF